MRDRPYNVFFLCTHNSARSILAECVMNRLAAGKFKAYSAGSQPSGRVTVCDDAANEVCPVWPGQPMTAHWGLPDPSRAEGNEAERRFAFADTHRMLNQRISIFISLPLASLDRLALKRRLDEIGRTRLDASREET
jgi:protein-tyrosine-phosphatase